MAASLFRSARGPVACVCSLGFVLACSLQDFDKFSSAEGIGGDGGTAGTGGTNEPGNGGTMPDTDGGVTGGNGGSAGVGGAGSGGGGDGGQGGTEDAGPVNLFENPSFETGVIPWTPFGTATLTVTTNNPRSGNNAVAATNRTESYMGPSIEISDLVEPSGLYTVGVWARIDEGETVQSLSLSLKTECVGSPANPAPFTQGGAAFPEWTYIEGTFSAPPADCQILELRVYVEGPLDGVALYIDDVSMYAAE